METRINGQIQSQNLWDGATLIDIMRKQAIEYDFNKGRMVINSILLADKTEVNNRGFLLDKIRDYGCAYQGWNLYAPYEGVGFRSSTQPTFMFNSTHLLILFIFT